MHKKILCPSCEEKFEVPDDIDLEEIVVCGNCYFKLKVVHVNPLKLVEVRLKGPFEGELDELEMNQ